MRQVFVVGGVHVIRVAVIIVTLFPRDCSGVHRAPGRCSAMSILRTARADL
jgi:hypothetical protein